MTGTIRPGDPAPPSTMVIFGGGGDLASRLLLPSLYNLKRSGLLPDGFAVIGIGRTDLGDDAYRETLDEALGRFATAELVEPDRRWLIERTSYLAGELGDGATYQRLSGMLDRGRGGANVVFYLAVPPTLFATVARELGAAGLLSEDEAGWRRIVIEKPFGTDLASAIALDRDLLRVADERQIFRIDHFLGKETVQNIMALRFGNGVFEPLWGRDHIDHVQITVAEAVTVEQRGAFYDATGALRDMVPNHLFQLLAMTAMEPPNSFDAEAIRTEKEKVIDALLPCFDAARDVVRAQYASGRVGERAVPAYRQEPEVDRQSETETFVAFRLMLDNWRWAGVPFYLRTGKAMAARKTEIAIRFKQAPFALFRATPVERMAENTLVLRLQPEEGVALHFNAKRPGPSVELGGVRMDFDYKGHFKTAPSTGYETLIYDCMIGDATLFQRADIVEAGWRVVQPILDAWSGGDARDLETYPAGSDGPDAAAALLARDGRKWRPIAASAAS